MKYTLVELDDRAKQYIVEKTEFPGSLLQAVRKSLDIGEGVVYSIWPQEASQDEIYSFRDGPGGVLLSNIELEQCLIDHICSYLSLGSDKVVIFDKACASRTDTWLTRATENLLFCNDEVYLYLLAEHNERETILRHMRTAMRSWRNWVLFSSLPPGTTLANRGELSADLINALAERAEKHAIDAYDFDGYLIWEL